MTKLNKKELTYLQKIVRKMDKKIMELKKEQQGIRKYIEAKMGAEK